MSEPPRIGLPDETEDHTPVEGAEFPPNDWMDRPRYGRQPGAFDIFVWPDGGRGQWSAICLAGCSPYEMDLVWGVLKPEASAAARAHRREHEGWATEERHCPTCGKRGYKPKPRSQM